ncbi:hypothetical protein BB560_005013 [Smittium megazygosporum]|uniref:Uncharacterized protein n=1 Tax=Smittium megazygosporum TaxID=133381 RepID=A0A2T9Z7S5_9FUNG|nr:hypothetical protein BB560_005013 [Smittium megazygosporum]
MDKMDDEDSLLAEYESMMSQQLLLSEVNESGETEAVEKLSEVEEDQEYKAKLETGLEFSLFSFGGPVVVTSGSVSKNTATRGDVKDESEMYYAKESAEILENMRASVLVAKEIQEQSKIPWPRNFFKNRVVSVDKSGIILGTKKSDLFLKNKKSRRRNNQKEKGKLKKRLLLAERNDSSVVLARCYGNNERIDMKQLERDGILFSRGYHNIQKKNPSSWGRIPKSEKSKILLQIGKSIKKPKNKKVQKNNKTVKQSNSQTKRMNE